MHTIIISSVCYSNINNYYPSSGFQILIVLSLLPETIRLPSVETQTDVIFLVCPSK
jgi:hypothetical protein